jgi:hypothetical protein
MLLGPPRHPPAASAFALDLHDIRLTAEGSFDESAAVADAAAFPRSRAMRAVEPEFLSTHEGRVARPRIRHGALRRRAFASRTCRRLRSREHSSHPEIRCSIYVNLGITFGSLWAVVTARSEGGCSEVRHTICGRARTVVAKLLLGNGPRKPPFRAARLRKWSPPHCTPFRRTRAPPPPHSRPGGRPEAPGDRECGPRKSETA